MISELHKLKFMRDAQVADCPLPTVVTGVAVVVVPLPTVVIVLAVVVVPAVFVTHHSSYSHAELELQGPG